MSQGGDFAELIEGVEKFAVEEISKVRKEFYVCKKETDRRLDVMEAKVKNLTSWSTLHAEKVRELETNYQHVDFRIVQSIAESKTEEKSLVQKALTAASTALDIPYTTSSLIHEEHLVSSGIHGQQDAPASVATTSFYSENQDFVAEEDEIDEETKKMLEPFFSAHSSSDKLAQCGRAFFKYFLAQHTTDGITDILARRCNREGQELNAWKRGYKPEGVLDFQSYLKERMRNQRKYSKRLSLRKDQRKRLSAFLNDSLRHIGIPKESSRLEEVTLEIETEVVEESADEVNEDMETGRSPCNQ